MTIGERSWDAESWSVAGATIAGDLDGLIDGSVYPATLRFGNETALEIHTTVTLDIGKQGSRFLFESISDPHAELLHQLVDRYKNRGAEKDLLHLLNTANDNTLGSSATRFSRWVRSAVMLLFTGALLAAAAWMLYLAYGTVTSAYAAVSAEGRTVSMPFKGTLSSELPIPGTTLAAGEIIGEIASEEISRRIASLDAEEIRLVGEIDVARERLAELASLATAERDRLLAERAATMTKLELASQRLEIETRQLERVRKIADMVSKQELDEQVRRVVSVKEEIGRFEAERTEIDFRLGPATERLKIEERQLDRIQRLADVATARSADEQLAKMLSVSEEIGILQAERTAIDAKLASAVQRLEIESRQIDRMRSLADAATERSADDQAARVLAIKEEVSTIQREIADLDGRLSHLAVNISGASLSSHTLTAASLNTAIATNSAILNSLRTERDELRRHAFIRSPCDCLVVEVRAHPGDRIAEQGVLAILVDPQTTFVEALIPVSAAAGLRNGDRARLELADRRKLEGEIVAISYQPRAGHRIGLPGRLDEVPYARLDLQVPDLDPADIGLVVHVRVLSRKLENLFGWDLIRNLSR